MKNGDLTRALAKTTGLSVEDCERVIHTTVETIVNALAAEKTVQIHGFGSFAVRNKNCSDTDKKSNASNSVFSPGKAFRDAVKKNHSK